MLKIMLAYKFIDSSFFKKSMLRRPKQFLVLKMYCFTDYRYNRRFDSSTTNHPTADHRHFLRASFYHTLGGARTHITRSRPAPGTWQWRIFICTSSPVHRSSSSSQLLRGGRSNGITALGTMTMIAREWALKKRSAIVTGLAAQPQGIEDQ